MVLKAKALRLENMSELDLSLEIRQIRSIFDTIAEVTDLPKLEIEIAELEKAAQVRDQLTILKEQAFGATGGDNILPLSRA